MRALLLSLILAAVGCNPTEPLLMLAKPAPELHPAVQAIRAIAVGGVLLALVWAMVRIVVGWPAVKDKGE